MLEAGNEDSWRAAAVFLERAGKVANGIVTVHLVVAHGPFQTLLDSELFLPESWDADRERCREADVPDEVRYRSKWQIRLELLARTERTRWRFDWLTFDEWYGGKPGFLRRCWTWRACDDHVGEGAQVVLVSAGTKPDCSAERCPRAYFLSRA